MLHAIEQNKAGHNFNSNGNHLRELFKTSEDSAGADFFDEQSRRAERQSAGADF